jgi:CrcB protein
MNILLVAVGGALGSVARYLWSGELLKRLGPGWPYGVFTINILGGLLMGMLVGALALRGGADQEKWRVLVGVGMLGGFTTFSSFSLDVALMIERRAYGQALAYGLGSVVLSVIALFVGLMLVRRVLA